MLICICGNDFGYNMGNLKSYTMTLMLYLDHLNGREIKANYWLGFPHEPVDSLNELLYKLDDMNNASIGADELSAWFSNYDRPSNKDGTREIVKFGRQTRKRGVKMYFTAQSWYDVNKALRRITHNIYVTAKYHPDFTLCYDDDCRKPHLLGITPCRAVDDDLIPLGPEQFYPVIPEIFEVYDTEQIIT